MILLLRIKSREMATSLSRDVARWSDRYLTTASAISE